MAKAEKGNTVTINFTGTLDDGTVFDSTLEYSECCEDECCDDECCDDSCDDGCEDDDCSCGGHTSGPMTITLGEESLFPQIETAIIGMSPGEKKIVKISAVDAFGEYDKEKVFTVPRSELPDDLIPEVGDELSLSNEDDEELDVVVLETIEDQITFDANHPLAGEDVTFEIELISIP